MIHLRTTRTHNHAHLQDLKYTYDPIGNITSIADHAQQTVYFDNQVVSPSNDYIYDAIYRLIEAHGREHIGLLARPQVDWNDQPRMNQPQPGDGQAMRRYQEDYQYDLVGNILSVIHHAADGNWRRHYDYSEFNNRLERTRVGEIKEHYAYDANGNMVRMPHLPHLGWDFKNQLHVTREQVVNLGDGQRTFYVYDSAGQRVRKITERPDGSRAHERIYLGGFEIYREYHRNKVSLERETLHVMDDKRRIALVETKTIDIEAQPNHLPHVLIRYQFTNHLESSSLELDEQAAIISYEEYYPYGSTSYEAVRKKIEASPKRYRYTGKERDSETGLYYHGARYYASWLGRWTAPDPKGLAGSANLFAYCSNNPVILCDPNGMDDVPAPTAAEEDAQACLIDPSTPAPTAAEEGAEASSPSEHPAASGAMERARWAASHMLQQATPAAQPAPSGPDPWYRFTYPAFSYETGPHDIFKPVDRYESGNIAWNLVANTYFSLNNLATIPFNAITEAAALPDEAIRAVGGSETDVESWHFVSMMMGVGEINALPSLTSELSAGATTLEKVAPVVSDATLASGATSRTFYTVQGEADAARLMSGGAPWPTGVNKSLLGEGLYTWQNEAQAQAYLSKLEEGGATGLKILKPTISEADYQGLKIFDTRTLGDEARQCWMDSYSLYGDQPAPHGFEHIIRETNNFGPEFYFSKDVFHLFGF